METIFTIARGIFTDNSTISPFCVVDGANSVLLCQSLEDTVRKRDKNNNGVLDPSEKVYGQTAIPNGRYEIRMCWSNHFKRMMPHLHSDWVTCTGEEQPGKKYLFKDIMIHWANKPSEILGCIAVGRYDPTTPDWVSDSQKTFNFIEPKILAGLGQGQVFLNISGGYRA